MRTRRPPPRSRPLNARGSRTHARGAPRDSEPTSHQRVALPRKSPEVVPEDQKAELAQVPGSLGAWRHLGGESGASTRRGAGTQRRAFEPPQGRPQGCGRVGESLPHTPAPPRPAPGSCGPSRPSLVFVARAPACIHSLSRGRGCRRGFCEHGGQSSGVSGARGVRILAPRVAAG